MNCMSLCHPGNRRRRLSGIHQPYVQNNAVSNVAWTRFLCQGLLYLDIPVCTNNPGHKKRVQATVSIFSFIKYASTYLMSIVET